ncbi:flagellar protein FlaG [Desulforamulus ruminis]|uniref:Flagellar protein FlaG protein n=1 Tax=Desulforamulus ruminis (strain ATCC 23193 / DSM 2154 / NCIMB 8452 / DL) TaxID=696281 RepID=F6DNR0_DESRL|nr:flagellar protein FlaG [Desulforamulus ruminis]AEG59505.1 flagellar protein FlaG protein [Desulforamulus ruminis DSM 2154]
MVDSIGNIASIPQEYFPTAGGSQDAAPLPGEKAAAPEESPQGATGQDSKTTAEQIKNAVEKMNKTMETYNTELRFKLHEKSGEYMIKIVSTKDNSVIREIPPEKILNMVAYFKEMLGFVVDKFA